MTVNVPAIPEATDKDNALILVDNYKDIIRYAADAKVWFVWNGSKWQEDQDGLAIIELWTDIAYNHFPKHTPGPNGNLVPFKWRNASLSDRGIKATINVAKTDSRVRVNRSDFDSNAYELNTPSGIVNLKTCALTHPEPSKLHTKQTNFAPNFNTPTRWLRFLQETFQGDQDTIRYVQKLLGVALVGEQLEQFFPFAHGPGGSGKGTLFNTVYKILGDYAQTQSSDLILRKQNADKSEAIANLQGARYVLMSELDKGSMLDEATLKNLTGNDPLKGRFLYQKSFSFLPTHTLILFGNSKPRANEGGEALFRRLKIIPFDREYSADSDDKTLQFQLLAEASNIFGWVIEGLRLYYEDGHLRPSAKIQEVTDDYQESEDQMGLFISECCLTDPSLSIMQQDLFRDYKQWCLLNGFGCTNTVNFTKQLKEHPKGRKIKTQRSTGGKSKLIGITAKAHEDNPSREDVSGIKFKQSEGE